MTENSLIRALFGVQENALELEADVRWSAAIKSRFQTVSSFGGRRKEGDVMCANIALLGNATVPSVFFSL